MEELVKNVIDFETKIIANIIFENKKIPNRRDLQKVKKLVLESYVFLNEDEKRKRLQMVEGLKLKSKTMIESDARAKNYDEDDLARVSADELKSILYEEFKKENMSYLLLESPYHYKSYIVSYFLVPPAVKKRVQESGDIGLNMKLNALYRMIGELVVGNCC